MPTPFPGMDPYLEQRGLWEQVHTRLIVAIADALVPLVRPKYRVDIELRVYQEVGFTKSKDDLVGMPDVVIAEKPLREAAAVYNADPRMLIVELPEVHEVRERFLCLCWKMILNLTCPSTNSCMTSTTAPGLI